MLKSWPGQVPCSILLALAFLVATAGVEAGSLAGGERCGVSGQAIYFTDEERGYEEARKRVNAMLDARVAPSRDVRMKEASDFRVPADAVAFALTVDAARCADGDGAAGMACADPACSDGFPGDPAPGGAIMTLVACTQPIRTTAVYERVDDAWVVVSIEKESAPRCTLAPPGD